VSCALCKACAVYFRTRGNRPRFEPSTSRLLSTSSIQNAAMSLNLCIFLHNRSVCSPLPRNSEYLFMGYKGCRRRKRTPPCLVTNTMVCPLENKETSEGGRYFKFLVIIIPRKIKIRYIKCRNRISASNTTLRQYYIYIHIAAMHCGANTEMTVSRYAVSPHDLR
jgi:hypothetical protein